MTYMRCDGPRVVLILTSMCGSVYFVAGKFKVFLTLIRNRYGCLGNRMSRGILMTRFAMEVKISIKEPNTFVL